MRAWSSEAPSAPRDGEANCLHCGVRLVPGEAFHSGRRQWTWVGADQPCDSWEVCPETATYFHEALIPPPLDDLEALEQWLKN